MTRTYTHPDGFTFEVRLGSWLPRLLGADGVTIGRTIRFRPGWGPNARLLSHETRHLQQIRSLGAGTFLWRYLTRPTFRRQMEAEANEWAAVHRGDLWITAVIADLKVRG